MGAVVLVKGSVVVDARVVEVVVDVDDVAHAEITITNANRSAIRPVSVSLTLVRLSSGHGPL